MIDKASAGRTTDVRLQGAFGGFALDVAFEAPGRGITALFGPSGCGKTTVLRAVAGLHRFETARVVVGGQLWQDGTHFVPVHRRAVGFVFQEASLFPHLSVAGNLAFAARRAAGEKRVGRDETIEMLGLDPLLGRSPSTLSGGERQRVAIGRALLTQPEILLMDEPLAALDRFARDDILPYFERLRDRLEIPVLYVSHDIAEVGRLAEHLLLMRDGRLVADGPLADLQARPDLPLAGLADAGVTLAAEVSGRDEAYGLSTLAVAGGRLVAPGAFGPLGSHHRIRIAASDVAIVGSLPQRSSVLNFLPARIVAAEPHGEAMLNVALALGTDGDGAHLLARLTRRSWDDLGLGRGQAVFAQLKSVALVTAAGDDRPA